jgi:hypothetical protein
LGRQCGSLTSRARALLPTCHNHETVWLSRRITALIYVDKCRQAGLKGQQSKSHWFEPMFCPRAQHCKSRHAHMPQARNHVAAHNGDADVYRCRRIYASTCSRKMAALPAKGTRQQCPRANGPHVCVPTLSKRGLDSIDKCQGVGIFRRNPSHIGLGRESRGQGGTALAVEHACHNLETMWE